jgi:capsular exopolysaccharide synthesis family protein
MSVDLQPYNPLLSPKIRRHIWVVFVCAGLMGCYRYLELLRQPDRFNSVGKMYVSGRVILSETPITYSEELANYLGTQIEIMRSHEIDDRSIQRLALNGIGRETDASLSIDVIKGTTILEIRSTSGNPEYARLYLDALMTEYGDFKKDRRLAVSQATVEQISTEVARLETDLEEHENAFFRFRENNNIGVWEQQSAASASYLNELKNREADLRLQLSLLENWRRISGEKNIRPASQVQVPGMNKLDDGLSQGEGMAQIRQNLNKLKIEREMRLRFLRSAHPIVISLDREIELQERLEKSVVEEMLESQEERQWALTSEIAGLQAAIEEWENKALQSSRIEAEYQKLRDTRDRTKMLYDRMLASLHNLDVGKGVDQELVQVLQSAGVPGIIPPDFPQAVMAGMVMGGLIGGGIMLLLIRTDDRTYDLETVVDQLGCPGLGEIPLLNQSRVSRRRSRFEQSAFEESFRRLRSLLLQPDRTKPLILLVTSSIASEGKTEIAVQLGKSFAAANQKVLMVDGDLRRGRMREIFPEIEENAKGFSDYLSENLSPADVICETNTPNLQIVPRGEETKVAGELFSNKPLKERIGELITGRDVVIIDSAPIGPVDDSTHLLKIVDTVLFVLRAGNTSLRIAAQNMQRIKNSEAKDVKIVLNGVNPQLSSKYYNYYR